MRDAKENNRKIYLAAMERMVEALNIDKTASSDQMLKNVRKAVDDFVGDADQFDDLTMLGIRFNG